MLKHWEIMFMENFTNYYIMNDVQTAGIEEGMRIKSGGAMDDVEGLK